MISRITAFTIGGNYPENIHISPYEENGKYGYAIYLLKDEQLHSLLASTGYVFQNEQEAKSEAIKLCESCWEVEIFGVKARKEVQNG